MNRKFSLAGLARVRQLQEERAAADLALANRQRQRAEIALDEHERSLASQDFPEHGPTLAELHAYNHVQHVPTWHAVVAARASVAAMLRESNEVLRLASADANRATDEWNAAKMRAAMIDKLKERHDREVEAEDLREEQIVLDETALRRTLEVQQ